MQEDQHKHLRRLERVWVESPVYFVTVCTHQRQTILADTAVAGILADEWRAAERRHGWLVGRYAHYAGPRAFLLRVATPREDVV